MVTVKEATACILSNCFQPQPESVPLVDCVGRFLAEAIRADRDLPPFDRVAMDGVAVRWSSLQRGLRVFTVAATQAAGAPPVQIDTEDCCIEVMTGAVLPEGWDVVVRYEDVVVEGNTASLAELRFVRFQNVHRKGADSQQGDVLVQAGVLITPAEVAVLASVGKSHVKVRSLPRVAIVSTGDELVDVDEEPSLFQIRRSNSYMLQAAFRQTGIISRLHHIADQEEVLQASLGEILSQADAVIISGGISKGKFDFVPRVLEQLGVKKQFQHVSQRPGKPFLFGTMNGKVVFALPGNPVSTFLCYCRYIRPWLKASLGTMDSEPVARLAVDYAFEPPLTCFLQVQLAWKEGSLWASPVPGGGSGDFANLRLVDGFLELPADRKVFKAGEAFPLIAFRPLG